MKQTYLFTLVIMSVFLLSSCKKETSASMMSNPEVLEGTWFRSYPNNVWGGHNQPSFERGETHVRITFQDNGDFIHNRTTLGLYEGTSIEDTTAVIIESGTFIAEEQAIEIILNKRIWWDSFYDDMEDFEESGVHSNKFMDASFEILNQELNFVYYTTTDLIVPEQETPGLDKFEHIYVRE